MKKTTEEWQVYRSKFLTRAKRLKAAMTFVDALGQEQRGKRGDYLVEHGSGLQRIWPRQMFESSHVRADREEISQAAKNGTGWKEPTAEMVGLKGRKGPASCGKATGSGRIPAVNCMRYNM